jgi:hypothetical protein
MTFPSISTYPQWAVLRDELVPFIGERAVSLLCYTIAQANDCLGTSVLFRRELIDSGEDPDAPQVTEAEQLMLDWAGIVAVDSHGVPEALTARLETAFSPQLRSLLLQFTGLMVATDLVTIVGRVPLDQELYPFRRPGDERTAG